MKVVKEIYYGNDFYKLKENSWSGAIDTLNAIEKANFEQEFMELLDVTFEEEVDETKLNDFIWFDRDYIYEQLGLNEEGE